MVGVLSSGRCHTRVEKKCLRVRAAGGRSFVVRVLLPKSEFEPPVVGVLSSEFSHQKVSSSHRW
jgi:hypothetical protein